MFSPDYPLVDIHRHLDGNIRPQTIIELAHHYQLPLPADNLADLRPYLQVAGQAADLVSFLQKLDLGVSVLASLEACRRIAYENVEDAHRAGLHYAELRFSPFYMARSHQLPLQGVVEAVIDGVQAACRQLPIQIQLIGILSRTFGVDHCQRELDSLLTYRQHIVALDLAGDELAFPANQFISHFKQARDAGLHITVHAGEAAGAQSIWQAIDLLGAERIGHGVRSIDDPRLMDHLAQRQIGIESCLTSNLQTNTVRQLAQHPLRAFLRHGIMASINTDDPAVQGIEIKHEYQIAAPQAQLSQHEIWQAQKNGLAMAFLSHADQQRLSDRLQINH